MSGILNKIWSSNSLLNDSYTRGLTEQAIQNPEAELKVDEKQLSLKGKEIRQIKGWSKVGLFFEKLKLTLELVIPCWKSKIVLAFDKVELLRDAAARKANEIAQGILNQKSAENEMRVLNDDLADVERKILETEASKATQNLAFQKAKNDLEDLTKQRVSIPESLALIDTYSEKKTAADAAIDKKLEENKGRNFLFKKLEDKVREEAMKEKPHLEFMAAAQQMGTKDLRTNNLEEQKKKLQAALQELPENIERLEQNLVILEGQLNSTEGTLMKLLEQKAEIEKNITRVTELLKPKSVEAPSQVEEKGGKSVPDPVKKAEKAKGANLQADVSAATQAMLNDIENLVHADVATVWKGLFNKFDANIVKSWACDAEGNFRLELNQSMRAWIPSKDNAGKQDPSSGVVLVLGIDDSGKETGFITGKLDRENTDMQFKEGFSFFVKPDNAGANPGYLKLTNIKYNTQDDIRIITEKDLKKDYSGMKLWVVSKIANLYGTVDSNSILSVNKQRSFKNMIQNWNTEVEVVADEKARLGVK